jgi:nucleotidyltransferase/DNA polymerase involved in DNA repair
VRYLAFIQLDHFYVKELPGSNLPTVVTHDDCVLDADLAALKRGIRIGSGESEARAIMRGDGRFVAWDPEPFAKASHEWLTIASEFSDVIEPVQQHAAYVDLSLHPRPGKIFPSILKTLSSRLQLEVTGGLGPNRWLAKEVTGIITDARTVTANLDTRRLPADSEDIARLIQLGYRRIGEVAEIPFATLRRQFGERALGIARAARGGGDSEVQAKFPESSVASRFTFDGPPDTLEVLDRGLYTAADLLGKELSDRDAGGKQVELFFEREDGSVETRRRTFSQPIADREGVCRALKLMTSSLPDEQVYGLRVRMPGIVKATRVQLDLSGIKSKSERESSLRGALDRVCALFGTQAVVKGNEVQEPRWKTVRRVWGSTNGWTW